MLAISYKTIASHHRSSLARYGDITDFPPSLHLVEEVLLERSIVVSYETIRHWGRKFRRSDAPATTPKEVSAS